MLIDVIILYNLSWTLVYRSLRISNMSHICVSFIFWSVLYTPLVEKNNAPLYEFIIIIFLFFKNWTALSTTSIALEYEKNGTFFSLNVFLLSEILCIFLTSIFKQDKTSEVTKQKLNIFKSYSLEFLQMSTKDSFKHLKRYCKMAVHRE